MKRSAHSKVVLDDSWITVDTTSLHQHKLYYYVTESLKFIFSPNFILQLILLSGI